MNVTILSGNIVRNAVINAVDDKTDAVSFNLATNRSYKDAESGEWKTLTSYHNCTRFLPKGKGAKLQEALTQGRSLQIQGAIKKSGKRKAKEGDKEYVNHYVRVEDIVFGSKGGAAEQPQG